MYLRAIGRHFTQMNAYFLVMNSKRCIIQINASKNLSTQSESLDGVKHMPFLQMLQPLTCCGASDDLSHNWRSGQNRYTQTGPTKPQNTWLSLPARSFLNLKRWCVYCIATPLSSNLTFLVYLAMLTLAS